MSSKLTFRIYYEDTDAGGVVYYANYLRFLERARTEVLRELGFEQARMLRENRIVFAVRSLSVEYLKPARLDDLVEVTSTIRKLGRAQVVFQQQIARQGEALLDAQVRVACLDPLRDKPVAIPRDIYEKFKALMGTPA